jgi:signal transduction histidine kinase
MKTPLALIRLFAETLDLGRVTEPAKVRQYYRVIHGESQRLTRLIDRILDFARIESGRKQYQFAEADLGQIVEDVLQAHQQRIVSMGFTLGADVQPQLPLAMADAQAISQALLNLIDNAVKYSPDRKALKVRVAQCGHEIRIEVADQGIGISASEQERIFEKFYRVNTSLVHDTKGSGLGLRLTKHAVEAHGGRIQVESRPGHGSRFTICIPLCQTECVEPAEREPAAEPVAESAHH